MPDEARMTPTHHLMNFSSTASLVVSFVLHATWVHGPRIAAGISAAVPEILSSPAHERVGRSTWGL